jgi:peptidoglycan/xylan/chitin deacetylase (PgdA/CDA1 family)
VSWHADYDRRSVRRLIPLPVAKRLAPAAAFVGARRVARGTAVVLMYHRVADVSFDPWRLAVSPERFAEQIAALRRHFEPVTLAALADDAERGSLRPRAVAVTFDDGYRDGLTDAKPILEQHGVPATVFVASGYVGSSRDFWWHELERCCFSPSRPSEGRFESGSVSADWSAPSDELYFETWRQLQALPHAERSERLAELAAASGAGDGAPTTTMTEVELVQLADGGLIEVGGHTVNHPSLPILPPAKQLGEIRDGRLQLERILGRAVTSFSFPHGDHTAESVGMAREAGFERACVSVSAPVHPGADRFQLPRRRVVNWTGDEFTWHLSRFFR